MFAALTLISIVGILIFGILSVASRIALRHRPGEWVG